MDIRSLQLFLSLTETLNFSRTAEQRHMSLSTVSRSLQRLEAELGQRLFERETGRHDFADQTSYFIIAERTLIELLEPFYDLCFTIRADSSV